MVQKYRQKELLDYEKPDIVLRIKPNTSLYVVIEKLEVAWGFSAQDCIRFAIMMAFAKERILQ